MNPPDMGPNTDNHTSGANADETEAERNQSAPSNNFDRAESDDSAAVEEESLSSSIGPARARKHKPMSVIQFIFGIGPTRRGVEGSRIIHPNSWFAQGFSLLSTFILFYVAIVTPVTIGFFWTADGCEELPTLKIDMFVDCFFLFEILLSFFIGITHQGRYRDDLPFVVKTYLRSSFGFDVITSIPVAIIEYIALQSCFDGGEPTVEAAQLRIVRATKPLRIFKMVRILKTSRLVFVFDWLESEMRPPPFTTRILRVLFSIGMIVHLCTCCFWLIKDAYQQDYEKAEFLADHGLPANAALVDKYLVGMYFINTVFTTVGFGDIYASNGAERIYYVIVMYVGTLVFGAMLGEVQMAMAQLRKVERERSEVVQETKDYLRGVETSPHLERKLLRWVNFDFDCRRQQERRENMQNKFPPMLRRQLATHVHREQLHKLPVFNEMQHADRHQFLLELFLKMESKTSCRGHPIARCGQPADALCIIVQGQIKVTMGDARNSPAIATLIPGDYLGEYALFEETTWKTSQGKPATFWCETHVECLVLTREDFLSVLLKYPQQLEEEVFFLADQVRHIRERTSYIDDVNILRWCQLLCKLNNKRKHIDIETKTAHARRTTFRLALHQHRMNNQSGGVERVRKSSLMLHGSTGNLLHASTNNLNSNSNSFGAKVAATAPPPASPLPKLLPTTQVASGEANGTSSGGGGDMAAVSQQLAGLESLMRIMHAEWLQHRQSVTKRLDHLEESVAGVVRGGSSHAHRHSGLHLHDHQHHHRSRFLGEDVDLDLHGPHRMPEGPVSLGRAAPQVQHKAQEVLASPGRALSAEGHQPRSAGGRGRRGSRLALSRDSSPARASNDAEPTAGRLGVGLVSAGRERRASASGDVVMVTPKGAAADVRPVYAEHSNSPSQVESALFMRPADAAPPAQQPSIAPPFDGGSESRPGDTGIA